MRTYVVVAAGLAVGIVLGACRDDANGAGPADAALSGDAGGGGDGASPTGSGYVPASGADGASFCDGTLGAVAGALDRCCTAGDKATKEYGLVGGVVNAVLTPCRDALAGATSRGRLLVDRGLLASCLAAYDARYGAASSDACADVTTTFREPAAAECRRAFAGTGDVGAGCRGDHECKDGLTCVGATTSSDGACAAPPALGAACGPAQPEAGSSSSAIDLEFESHPKCAPGGACSRGSCVPTAGRGESCALDADCASPLVCVAGRCADLGDVGATCTGSGDCKPGLGCAVPPGGGDGSCAEKKSAGATCTYAFFGDECWGRCDAGDGGVGSTGSCATFCGSK